MYGISVDAAAPVAEVRLARWLWPLAFCLLTSLASGCRSEQAKSDKVENPGSEPTSAPRPIKIGVLAPMSGPFAGMGSQIEGGIQAYLRKHQGKLGGRPVELLLEDTTGVKPDLAKRLAQGLVVREHVDFLAGFVFTPNALAVAPIATESKTPMVIMNAATSTITTRSPFAVRFSFTLPQVTAPMASWAKQNGIDSAYVLVSDYAPGHDAEAQFRRTFESAGGKVVGSVRVPVQNPDFAPYVQRIKDERPQAVFVFVPAGAQGIAFMKAFRERGLHEAGVRVIATGDVTEDYQLPAMGEAALGVVTTHHYSLAHDSPLNEAFKAAFAEVKGKEARPNFMAVGAFDGMAGIDAALAKLGSPTADIDGEEVMKAFAGMKLESPRGSIRIDAMTRDVVQTVYVRRVEKLGDELHNVEFDRFEELSDPGK